MKPTLFVLAFLLLAPACKRGPSAADLEGQLVEVRLEKRRALDAIYARYKEASGDEIAPKGDRKPLPTVSLGSAGKELLRLTFEKQCLSAGSGNRPMLLSEASRRFFAEEETLAACKEAAALDRKVDALASDLNRHRAAAK